MLVCGGRKFHDELFVRQSLDSVRQFFEPIFLGIEGGARCVDTFAKTGFTIKVHRTLPSMLIGTSMVSVLDPFAMIGCGYSFNPILSLHFLAEVALSTWSRVLDELRSMSGYL